MSSNPGAGSVEAGEQSPAPRCPVHDVAPSTGYTHKSCRCDTCQAWKKKHNKEYNTPYMREYREKNKEKVKRWDRERYARVSHAQKLMLIASMGGECWDCGESYPAAVYDFHHRNPEEKENEISSMFAGNWDTLVEEARKCDLLCANCHRLRH